MRKTKSWLRAHGPACDDIAAEPERGIGDHKDTKNQLDPFRPT